MSQAPLDPRATLAWGWTSRANGFAAEWIGNGDAMSAREDSPVLGKGWVPFCATLLLVSATIAGLVLVRTIHHGRSASDRAMPAGKLDARVPAQQPKELPRRGTVVFAKLRFADENNNAPLAVPDLTRALRERLKFDMAINPPEILASDPTLHRYPLLYMQGLAAFDHSRQELAALRKHLDPGGGTIFADAARGNPAFDISFRKFVAELMPDQALVPIPREDDLYTRRVCYDLNDVEYTKAAGGQRGFPQLEGVKLNGHWALIYSKYAIGDALEHPQEIDCEGYTHQSASSIAANIVLYAILH
jgi:hypothetical protein